MVCPRIWGLGLVRQRMGKCGFANLARCGRAFRRPIPERTPETVCGSVDPKSLQQLHERGVVKRLVGGGTRGEDEAVAERAGLIENRNRSFAQRDTMLALGLHPVRRHRCSVPQRLEDFEHVVRVYVRYGSLGESREGEFFEATDPLTRV